MQDYNYLFGPVPSRRLGVSLGVDLVPFKTCTYNCVYCECGLTEKLTLDRKEYIDPKIIIEELDGYLSGDPELDYITFSGGGEPTLNSGIGRVVNFLKEHYPDYMTALLTNGSLLYRDEVIEDIRNCGLVIPSLDAVSPDIYKKINNPPEGFGPERIVAGIKKLRLNTDLKIWVEIFIIPGVNDNPEEIDLIKKTLIGIRPDKIQLNSLDRPGAESWVKQAPLKTLENIRRQLLPLETEIIGGHKVKRKNITGEKNGRMDERILGLLRRRPCTVEDIAVSFGAKKSTIMSSLRKLENSDRILKQKKKRGEFYKSND